MSKKEDLLFCKIAIQSGMVSEEQARKVLAFCNKKEMEDGRRPMIGALFTKYNLINNQQSRQIYDAVNKRTGGTAGMRPVPPAAARRGGSRSGGRGGGRGRRDRQPRQTDPSTLYMGLGFGAVFVVIILVMVYVLMKPSDNDSGTSTGGPDLASASSKPDEPEEPEEPREPISRELTSDAQAEAANRILDAKRELGEVPERGLKIIENVKKSLEKKREQGYDVSELISDANEVEDALRAVIAEDAAAEDAAGEGASEDGDSADATAADDAGDAGDSDEDAAGDSDADAEADDGDTGDEDDEFDFDEF